MSLKKFTEWCEFKEMDANQMTMGGATPMASAQAPAQPAGNETVYIVKRILDPRTRRDRLQCLAT